MARFDTHVHLWLRGDGNRVRIRERVPELDRDFGLVELLPQLIEAEVERIVLVSAAQNEREPAGLIEVAHRHPDLVAGVIGWLDPGDAELSTKVARLAADPAWLGIRLPIVLEDATAFVAQSGIDAALDRLVAANAVVQVLVNPAQIATVAPLLERHPDLRVVIDHAANPDVAMPVSSEWRDGIRRLGGLPNAACKVSAFWLPGMPAPTADQLQPFADEILAAFGTERIVAASNWPVTTLLASPLRTFMACEQTFRLHAGAFYDNAARIYRRRTEGK